MCGARGTPDASVRTVGGMVMAFLVSWTAAMAEEVGEKSSSLSAVTTANPGGV